MPGAYIRTPIRSAQCVAYLGTATGPMELKKGTCSQEDMIDVPLDSELNVISGAVAFLNVHQPLLSLYLVGPGRIAPVAHDFRMREYIVDLRQICFGQKSQRKGFRRYIYGFQEIHGGMIIS